MARPATLDAALKRLLSALDLLEAACERSAGARGERRDLVDTLAVMQDDRSRLADELDVALTRTRVLEHATAEVALRLGHAGVSVRRLLAAAEERMG